MKISVLCTLLHLRTEYIHKVEVQVVSKKASPVRVLGFSSDQDAVYLTVLSAHTIEQSPQQQSQATAVVSSWWNALDFLIRGALY